MKILMSLVLAAVLVSPNTLLAEQMAPAVAEEWFDSLITETPAEGFALALRLARRSVTTIQTAREVLHALRPIYSRDSAQLIAASHVAAAYFDIVAQANNYWRDSD